MIHADNGGDDGDNGDDPSQVGAQFIMDKCHDCHDHQGDRRVRERAIRLFAHGVDSFLGYSIRFLVGARHNALFDRSLGLISSPAPTAHEVSYFYGDSGMPPYATHRTK